MADPAQLTRALLEVHPRAAQVVATVALEGLSVETAAERYGTTAPAFAVNLCRATQALDDVLNGRTTPLRSDADDALAAEALARGEGPLAALLAELRAHGPDVRLRLEQAAKDAETGPARTRETWLRRAAIVLILALTAYFWWRDGRLPLPGTTPPSSVSSPP